MTVILGIVIYLIGFVVMASAIRKNIPTMYKKHPLSTAKVRCMAAITIILWPIFLTLGTFCLLFDHFIPPPKEERQ